MFGIPHRSQENIEIIHQASESIFSQNNSYHLGYFLQIQPPLLQLSIMLKKLEIQMEIVVGSRDLEIELLSEYLHVMLNFLFKIHLK